MLRVGKELLNSLRIARAEETSKLVNFAEKMDKKTSKSKASEENKRFESKSQGTKPRVTMQRVDSLYSLINSHWSTQGDNA